MFLYLKFCNKKRSFWVQTPPMHLPDTLQTPSRHPPDTLLLLAPLNLAIARILILWVGGGGWICDNIASTAQLRLGLVLSLATTTIKSPKIVATLFSLYSVKGTKVLPCESVIFYIMGLWRIHIRVSIEARANSLYQPVYYS